MTSQNITQTLALFNTTQENLVEDDEDFERIQEISLYIMFTYLSVYAFLLLSVSILSVHNVRKEMKERARTMTNSKELGIQSLSPQGSEIGYETSPSFSPRGQELEIEATKQKRWKWYTPFQKWIKSVHRKRKVYISLLPHLFDQAVE